MLEKKNMFTCVSMPSFITFFTFLFTEFTKNSFSESCAFSRRCKYFAVAYC